jgi:serine protease Do
MLLLSCAFSQRWVTKTSNNYSKAVVYIMTNNDTYGSGFNINKNGLIVTNYHVVQGASEIVVEFLNGKRYPVNYYTYVDERKDFALLKISGKRLPVVRMGNSSKVNTGNEVVAIGNPLGQERSVTKGIISQIRNFEGLDAFQTDVYIGSGSSGGPLFNNSQYVIGITTASLAGSSDNINLAIPINYIQKALKISNQSTKKRVGYDVARARAQNPVPVSGQNNDDDLWLNCLATYCIYLLVLGLLPA